MKINTDFSLQLIELVQTKEDAALFVSSLENVLNDSFHKTQDIEETLSKYLSFTKQAKFIQLAQKADIPVQDSAKFKNFITTIRDTIKGIPTVSLALAFASTQQTINTISSWFLYEIKKAVLLEIHIDPTIIAGAIISYQGIYKDYSKRRELEEKMKNGKIILTTL